MEQQNRHHGETPQKKPTILIVDDQLENLELLVRILEKENYNTRPALNGQLALGAVAHTPPDLILLDIRMPEMDGFKVCKRLKADPQSRDIPVIFISALDDIDEKMNAFQAGGVDYISRPFQYPEVLARVATHLELAHMQNKMKAMVHKHTTAFESNARKLSQEITTHQATALQLRQSEENYRFLVESQNDLVIRLDNQNRLVFASPNVYSTFGKTADELIGRPVPELIEDENHQAAIYALATLAKPPHRTSYQGCIQTKQGQRWFDWSAKARVSPKGEIIDAVAVGRDITKTKETTIALETSEAKFRQLAENINEVFWVCSPDWEQLHYISPAYERIWGRSVHSLYQNPTSWLDAIVDQDRQKVKTTLLENIGKNIKQVAFPEYRIKRPDGTLRWIRDRAFPVFNSAGEVCRIAGIAEDITEKVALEGQLRQSYKMEAIGTLAGGIAHEFNNVLSIILGNTELVMDDSAAGSESEPHLREILKAALRGRDVITQLLNFSRKSVIERVPFDLGQNVKEALQLIRASLPSTIDINTQIEAPIHAVVADTAQISQLIINLCNNAAQAMEAAGGKLKITLNNTTLGATEAQKLGVPAADYVKLSVTDTGHGIKPDILDKIFDPYFTTRSFGKGKGMGLAIVHGIVGSHQGAIAVQSSVGQGTRFDVYLPVSQRASKPAATYPQVVPSGKETILFVDDEPGITRIAKTVLNRLGYTVWVENDPAKALQRIQSEPEAFNLVITDMTMPHMTGEQLANEILKIRKDMPIILCTGHNQRIGKHRALAMGIRYYIEKPFEKRKIAAIIRQVLDNDKTDQQEDRTLPEPVPSL